jgi:hypothetical protein
MTLKIKESDWITIDLDNPKTLPETEKNVIVMLNLAVTDRYYYDIPGPYICFVFQDVEDDKLKWGWEEPEEVRNGDKYVVLNWEALEGQWITVDLWNRATFPDKGAPCLIDNGNYIVGYMIDDDEDYIDKDSTPCVYWNDYSEFDEEPVEFDDKYIPLDFEGFPWLTK